MGANRSSLERGPLANAPRRMRFVLISAKERDEVEPRDRRQRESTAVAGYALTCCDYLMRNAKPRPSSQKNATCAPIGAGALACSRIHLLDPLRHQLHLRR